MPLQPVYLVAAKNLQSFLEALRHAQAPEKVSLRFIEDLGFKSTNDRLFVPLLKALKFIDDSGKPTSRYHSFLDDSEWKRILAEGIRDAYSDLFRINKNAHTFSRDQLTGKLKSLGEGKLSPSVLTNTTKTFLELVKIADFSATSAPEAATVHEAVATATTETHDVLHGKPISHADASTLQLATSAPKLVYRIEIVLPAVRDQAIYDAIFRSAREHLFR